jgi:hypothetical protein
LWFAGGEAPAPIKKSVVTIHEINCSENKINWGESPSGGQRLPSVSTCSVDCFNKLPWFQQFPPVTATQLNSS